MAATRRVGAPGLARTGQIDLAALLLGAAEAQLAGRGERLGNEQRLLAAVRTALEHQLSASALAAHLAAGAALSDDEIVAMISESLTQRMHSPR